MNTLRTTVALGLVVASLGAGFPALAKNLENLGANTSSTTETAPATDNTTPAPDTTTPSTDTTTTTQTTPADTTTTSPHMTMLEEVYPKTAALLQSEFPEDYAALQASIDDVVASGGGGTTTESQLFQALFQLRSKYATQVAQAPQEDLSALVNALASFHADVQTTGGAELCGKFALNGVPALFEAGGAGDYSAQLDAQSLAFFTAVSNAVKSPVTQTPAQDADWAAIGSRMIEGGATQADLDLISQLKSEDPAYCNAFISFLRTLADFEGGEGDRVRSSFAAGVTGY